MNLFTKFAYNALTKTIQAIAPGGASVLLASSESGVYTPVMAGGTNSAAVTTYPCQYVRVGKIVTVSGAFDHQQTSTGTSTFRLSLPIPSDFTSTTEAGGTGQCLQGQHSMFIASEATNNALKFTIITGEAAVNREHRFICQYEIK